MLEETPIRTQLEMVREDALRVLIVGAGVAGVTLARLLRRNGSHPVLLERTGPEASGGYMLALMPLVDPVLDDLGVTPDYLSRSIGFDRYRIRDRKGRPIREYRIGRLLNRYGRYRGISRGELMGVLGSDGGPVSYGATVTAIEQQASSVRVVISSGDSGSESEEVAADFDLVVAADGLHSATRGLVLDPGQVATYDTGWGGWVGWTDPDEDSDLGEELWGAGLFIGTYPVKDRIGIFLGGPRADTAAGRERFTERAGRMLRATGSRLDRALKAIARGEESYFWPLIDRRAATWSVGRVVLLGDAAAGFLPTAGIGACMAMESAWMLAGRLVGAAPDRVREALGAYERAQRPRVEAAQDNSRQLARLLFRREAALAAVRDVATRFVPLSVALRPIRRLLEDRPGR